MTMFERIAERLRGQKKGQEQAYWETITRIVATKDARAINALTDTLGQLGQAVGKRPSDVESDLALAGKLAQLCNAEERVTTSRKALRVLLNRSQDIESQAAELEARAKSLRADHGKELRSARLVVEKAQAEHAELATLRIALARAGHTESIKLIEETVSEERPEVVNA